MQAHPAAQEDRSDAVTDGTSPRASLRCLHEVLAGHAALQPDAIAVFAPDRPPLTFAALWAQIEQTVTALNALGIGRNDRVVIVLPEGPELGVALLAVMAGAVGVPLPAHWTATEYATCLSGLAGRAVVVPAGATTPVRAVAADLGLAVLELTPAPADQPVGRFTLSGLAPAAPAAHPGFAALTDRALMLYTSGTTGSPKWVNRNQGRWVAHLFNSARPFALTPQDRLLVTAPLANAHGCRPYMFAAAVGGSVVFPVNFSVTSFLPLVEQTGAAWTTITPAMLQAVLALAPSYPDLLARAPLRFIRTTGAPMPAAMQAEVETTLHAPVMNLYAMTEVGSIALNPLPPGRRKAGSVGPPNDRPVLIVGLDGQSLLQGQTGEVLVGEIPELDGYAYLPDADADDGWFPTGDEGYFDEDGYLFLTGRMKELINRGSEKISPQEVDEALLSHPAVFDAVAFGVPDASLGEAVAAAVALRTGAAASEAELREHAALRLAAQKVPHRIVLLDAIPRNATGKAPRGRLADMLADALRERAGAGMAAVEPRDAREAQLVRIWQEVLGLSDVGVTDDFFALGGNSLTAALLLDRLQREFGVTFPLDVLYRVRTIAQLAGLLRAGAASARRGYAASAASGAGLVVLQPDGVLPPLFCCMHPAPEYRLTYVHMAPHLGRERPVYGVQPVGLDTAGNPVLKIEDLAAECVRQLRERQPEGPYYLLGYSLSGVIAFEAAQQLRSVGQEVAFLGMLDTNRPGKGEPLLLKLERNVRTALDGGPQGTRNYLKVFARDSAIRLRWRALGLGYRALRVAGITPPAGRTDLEATSRTAAWAYRPQPYAGRVTLFLSEEQPPHQRLLGPVEWLDVAVGGFDIRHVPGDHWTLLREPRVAVLTRQLEAALAAAG